MIDNTNKESIMASQENIDLQLKDVGEVHDQQHFKFCVLYSQKCSVKKYNCDR